MAKNIIISFDYELFFGDNPGTVQNSIIRPTRMLLDALEQVGGKATFFVDYLMLKYMLAENEETKNDAIQIIDQLKDIVRRGSRIELHIHPHWVDAKYKNGQWDFSDYTHYCLNSFPEADITNMFVEGTAMLEQIAQEVVPNYKVIAYRAGGWAVLPFNIMRNGFIKSGIKVDSSISHGKIIKTEDYILDFTDVPNEYVYKFSDDVKKIDPNGEFIEAQIGSFKHNVITSLLSIHYHRKHKRMFKTLTDGSHKRTSDKSSQHNVKKMSKWDILHQTQGFGLGGLPSFLLNYEIRYCKQSHVVIISHPKDIKPITCKNIIGLKKFNFCTYKDLL